MTYYYAISDPHGRMDVLEKALSAVKLDDPGNRLFLLGDYIPHQQAYEGEKEFLERCAESLAFVKAFCEQHPGQVVALMGNHEAYLIGDVREGNRPLDPKLYKWMCNLDQFVETEWQIFVHAGIDEEAGEEWKWGTSESIMLGKHPATFGCFYKDIVAGHNGTFGIARMAGEAIGFNGALHDGQSHYFIDGSTERSGKIPILRFDTETGEYAAFLASVDGVTCEGAPYVPANLDGLEPDNGYSWNERGDWW